MNRLLWLDTIKGVAIILVVLGHVIDGYLSAGVFPDYNEVQYTLYNVCYSFHMPLFFILSGVSFFVAYSKRQGAYKYDRVKRQVLNIVLLYVLWSVILWCCKTVFASDVNNPITIYNLIGIPIVSISPYWYLYVLASCYLIYLLPVKYIESKLSLVLSLVLGLASYWIMTSVCGRYTIVHTLVYMFFFMIGTLVIRKEVKKRLILSITIVLIGFAVGCCTSYRIVDKIQWWINPICGFVIALFVGGGLVAIFQNVENRFLSYIGRHCLEIYVIHCILTAFNRKMLLLVGIDVFWINVLVNTFLSVAIPMLISEVMKKMELYGYFFKPIEVIEKIQTKSKRR